MDGGITLRNCGVQRACTVGYGKAFPQPDLGHRFCKEVWVNARHNAGLAALELSASSSRTAGNDGVVRRKRKGGGDSMARTSRRLFEDGELREVVGALDLLVQQECRVDTSLLSRVLKRCTGLEDVELGRRVHVLALESGFESNAFVATHIVDMYASHGKLEEAAQVFSKVTAPDTHLWASIILAHARHGQPMEAVRLYRQMRGSSVKPNNHIFVAVLKACASAEDLVSGQEVHADIRASDVRPNSFVNNSLVNMYAKCGSLVEARRVFDRLHTRDVVSWTSMIAGYARRGMGQEALDLYASMQLNGMTPANVVTFVCLLQACASVGALDQGKQIHAQVRGRGLEADLVVGNCLVDMYAKCGSLEDAREVFDTMGRRDVVTWTAMIAGYVQQGKGHEALCLYRSMQREGITVANQVTFVCLLQACAGVGALLQGKQLHALIREKGLDTDVLIGSCLVDMYAKCGSLKDARAIFDRLPTRDVVTWSALLNGYVEHCNAQMAMQCFEEMRRQGLEPNGTTFSSLLAACSHAGLVQEGQRYFRLMVEDHGIVPTDYHYSCLVDLLGRSGCLDQAEHILQTMPFKNYVVGWRSLLSACRNHGDIERGKRCFDRLISLEPENASSYVLLANIYANAGRWMDVDRIESLRRLAGATKKPAKACIEVKNKVHEFTVGEERPDISFKLKSVHMRLKEEGGHVSQTELVLKAMSEKEKEDALCGHAEKLALAYGLLNTPDGTPLLVTKNLRMCNDCHSSTKIMSRLEQREIIVRDAHRVHHFSDGSCSCGGRN